MERSAPRAILLKEEGNRLFKQNDFAGAEGYYSKALIADPSNQSLYTNRAMARLKMGLWEGVIDDCSACLKLDANNMKAVYYLSQAHLALRHYDDALKTALRARHICVETDDKNLSAATAQVLQCKKERWDDAEKKRKRETSALEAEVAAMFERERDEALKEAADMDEGSKTEIREEWQRKAELMTKIFDQSRTAEERRRKMPDWAIDDITFEVMVDPVITKSGKSYERASIMEHLRRHQTDPLTREPLQISDLRSNLGLKQACDEFLEENGWAADW
ncbi:U-box domain-containing protein [Apodospora peruviana]|uniref:E3 ubiquitin-protein ligase CHIP n=1 Tax=Apodospora peruviana TaxID=516989 RepID=A0AAE0I5L7_9PEZI|nr:U-box domain-containing protein [Apodospora peruviana]